MTIQEKYHFFSSFLPYGIYCKVKGIARPLKVKSVHIGEDDGVILNFGKVTDTKENLELYLGEVKICLLHYTRISQKEKKAFEKWERSFGKNDTQSTHHDCYIYFAQHHWDWLTIELNKAEQYSKMFECEKFVHYLTRGQHKKLYG